jgi:hypothetical protein
VQHGVHVERLGKATSHVCEALCGPTTQLALGLGILERLDKVAEVSFHPIDDSDWKAVDQNSQADTHGGGQEEEHQRHTQERSPRYVDLYHSNSFIVEDDRRNPYCSIAAPPAKRPCPFQGILGHRAPLLIEDVEGRHRFMRQKLLENLDISVGLIFPKRGVSKTRL